MRKFHLYKNSIIIKMTLFTVIVIISQSLFLLTSLVVGGVLEQAKLNAYESFQDKVSSRKSYLELEMKNRWTNIDPFVSQISKKITSKEYSSSTEILEGISVDLIEMLRTTKATGTFIILGTNLKSNSMPALYFRDYDPYSDNSLYSDLYTIIGPSEISKKLKIPLDQTWSYNYKINNTNNKFVLKPIELAKLSNDYKLLGYWSHPFRISNNDIEIMTYTMPMYDSENNLRGIIGVEISLNHLSQLLPASDFNNKDSLGYVLLHKENANEGLIPALIVGALQKRYINQDTPLSLGSKSKEHDIYKLLNSNSSETIYTNIEKIGLYQNNTPFESDNWYLAGFMRGSELFSYVNRIKAILWVGLIVSLVVGIVLGGYISIRFSKPIVELSDKVINSDKNEIMKLNETGLYEVDELAKSIQNANKGKIEDASRFSSILSLLDIPVGGFEIKFDTDELYITDKLLTILNIAEINDKQFKEKLFEIMSKPEEHEKGVYKIDSQPPKWVKINIIENMSSIIGVVHDITYEMNEKLQLIKDRDMDPLTRLLNRRAFEIYLKDILSKNLLKSTVLVMFDLDNLKMINDTYGHKWGDNYIVEATMRLNRIAKRNKMLLARRSGDEFMLLLYGFDTNEEISGIMELFYTHLEDTPIKYPDGKYISIKISAGLTWIKEWPTEYEHILHKADEALYKAKETYKGYWVINND